MLLKDVIHILRTPTRALASLVLSLERVAFSQLSMVDDILSLFCAGGEGAAQGI